MVSDAYQGLVSYLDATGISHEPGARDGEIVAELPLSLIHI